MSPNTFTTRVVQYFRGVRNIRQFTSFPKGGTCRKIQEIVQMSRFTTFPGTIVLPCSRHCFRKRCPPLLLLQHSFAAARAFALPYRHLSSAQTFLTVRFVFEGRKKRRRACFVVLYSFGRFFCNNEHDYYITDEIYWCIVGSMPPLKIGSSPRPHTCGIVWRFNLFHFSFSSAGE
jgi:hypothetical protein